MACTLLFLMQLDGFVHNFDQLIVVANGCLKLGELSFHSLKCFLQILTVVAHAARRQNRLVPEVKSIPDNLVLVVS